MFVSKKRHEAILAATIREKDAVIDAIIRDKKGLAKQASNLKFSNSLLSAANRELKADAEKHRLKLHRDRQRMATKRAKVPA